ncbi:hypothetical protein [Micromonospora echinofusca]|uniref:hypothetical protein n=1 Tax=Micromonospora echinofusca TaxID=47858 RepID=UPI003722E4D0
MTDSSPILYVDDQRLHLVDVPDEIFLREFLSIDTETESGAIAFLNFLAEWGPLPFAASLYGSWESVKATPERYGFSSRAAIFDPLNPVIRADQPGSTVGEHRLFLFEELERNQGDFPEEDFTAAHRIREDGEWDSVSLSRRSLQSQEVVLHVYQATFETLVSLQSSDLTPQRFEEKPRAALVELWSRRSLPEPETTFDLIDTCAHLVNAATSLYGPQLRLTHPDLDARGIAYGGSQPRILTVMCLQLLSFLSENVPVKRCANENCQILFAFQRGRAAFGQKRSTGVQYCSSSCANAVAQRRYRRRQRA